MEIVIGEKSVAPCGCAIDATLVAHTKLPFLLFLNDSPEEMEDRRNKSVETESVAGKLQVERLQVFMQEKLYS